MVISVRLRFRQHFPHDPWLFCRCSRLGLLMPIGTRFFKKFQHEHSSTYLNTVLLSLLIVRLDRFGSTSS